MHAQDEKRALRAQYAALRASLSDTQREAASAAICAAVIAHPLFARADLILGFFAVRGEVDLSPVYKSAMARGIPVALPRCEGERMTFRTVTDMTALEVGRFGIKAPRADAPLAPHTARTLCLVPALAADMCGTRLGYGGGFYDRFLADFKGTTVLPLYDCLLVPSLPVEETDIPVHVILTEKGERYRHG